MFATAALLVFGVPIAHAASTLYVNASTGADSPTCGASTSPCQTIQQAVDNAASGDTIQVAAGTYDERVAISEPLTLDGAQAGHPGSASRAAGTAATESIISQGIDLYSNANDATIDGFLFNDNTNQICVGIPCNPPGGSPEGPSNATIEDNVFTGYDIYGVSDNAIDVASSLGGHQIVANYFTSPNTDFGDHGGAVVQWNGGGGCDGSAVSDNIFYDADASALADIYFHCGDAAVSTITVSGNTDTISGGSSFVNFQHIGGTGGELDVTNNAITMTPSGGSGMYFGNYESGVQTVNITGNSLTGDPVRALKLSTNAELGGTVSITGNDFSANGVGVWVGSNALAVGAHLTLDGNNLSGETGDHPAGLSDPGAGVYIASSAQTPAQITATGNNLSGDWAGFYVDANGLDPNATVTLRANNLAGELGGSPPTVPADGVYNASNSGGSVDAADNWWGCNGGPGSTGCSAASSAVTSNPWLVLGVSASPTSLTTAGSSGVTADLTKNSNGSDTSGSGTLLDGSSVSFTTDLGYLSASSAATSAGRASVTVASGSAGTAHVSATFTGQTVSAPPVTFTAQPPPPEPSPTTTATTASTSTSTSVQAAVAASGSASVSVGSGASAATVTIPAGATSSNANLVVTEASPGGAGVSFAAGTTAIQVSVTSTGGQPITQFAQPLDLAFPNAPAGIVPAYSTNGSSWTEIPQVPNPPALPDGWPDGWYRDGGGTLHILTLHATYFGLLTATSSFTKALQLADGLRGTVNLNRTHTLVLHLQTTLPVTVTAALTRGKTELGSWHLATTASARAVRITLPKKARHTGAETLTLTAAAGGDTVNTKLPLRLTAAWKKA